MGVLSALCSSSVASGGTASLFPKAIVKTEDVELAIKTEWDQRKNYDVAPNQGEPWFSVIDGTSHVLISAPHATAQIREGKSKFADAGTCALAVLLNRLAKTPVIYTTRQSPSDPNFYDDNEYKSTLAKLLDKYHPKLVLDLHASHFYRPYDVDFGTMGGKSLKGHGVWLRHLSECFIDAGFRDLSQDYFAASTNQTVTKFVRTKGVSCVQLEFNETWLNLFNEVGIKSAGGGPTDISEDILRVDQHGAHRFSSTLEALVRFIGWIDRPSDSNH
ncbi:MAG TPA: hypothetical protein VEP30_01005 [Chthoniobacterales bacterium]|nr:hypothetical protein [Chthoniobacterales bacterium]